MLRDAYEFIGPKLHNAEFGNDFLNMILKAQAKKKVDKLHFMKIKNIIYYKTVNRAKKGRMGKIFTNLIVDLRLMSNIHKELLNNSNNNNKLNSKMGIRLK